MDDRVDKDLTGTTPAGGQQHGDGSGKGGSIKHAKDEEPLERNHPRPNTPGSKAEDQADQPGMTGDRR